MPITRENTHKITSIIEDKILNDQQKILELEKLNLSADDLEAFAIGEEEQSILHLAVKNAGIPLLEWLLQKSSTLIDKKNKFGRNILMSALETDLEKIKFLISKKASLVHEKTLQLSNIIHCIAAEETGKAAAGPSGRVA